MKILRCRVSEYIKSSLQYSNRIDRIFRILDIDITEMER